MQTPADRIVAQGGLRRHHASLAELGADKLPQTQVACVEVRVYNLLRTPAALARRGLGGGTAVGAVVALITDFGTTDGYAGALKGAVLAVCPAATLVDVTHELAPHDVRAAMVALGTCYVSFPAGTVFVCVVDPGVGSARRPIVVRTPDYTFVGPDNGWVTAVLADRGITVPESGLVTLPIGTPVSVIELDRPEYWRARISATFHGRDVFGPVAGWLASGIDPSLLGSASEQVHVLGTHVPVGVGDGIRGEVVSIDRFGNLLTNIRLAATETDAVAGVEIGGRTVPGLFRTYAQLESVGALTGSNGCVEIAARERSAARILGASIGDQVQVRLHPGRPSTGGDQCQ